MPDLLTPQVLVAAGPIVLETLFKHFLTPKSAKGDAPAREDLMYDEAFVLMKTFLEIATKHPAAALQRFGLVRTPAPPWVALHRILIPQSTLGSAADYLVTALGGEEMAYKIAGGSKWWQVRAGNGVEGEWIVMKKDWKEHVKHEAEAKKGKDGRKESKRTEGVSMHADEGTVGEDGGLEENGHFRKEMDELRCMLYIHGGAYYWGSINTHRYTIWRYARKMQGRCFAVNYRTPQYPFPCAIQDCLAAYLYLVNPPPEARHKPVNPKNIILAGDSAGGGLVLALLQILRDTEGLELPSGAVLISPWSDLTHSFPSILSNTATDIVPPYGFIHKPSSLWPPPPPALTDEIQETLRTRVREAVSRLKGDHHHHRRRSIGKKEPDAPLIKEPTEGPHFRTSSPHEGAPGGEQPDKSDLYPVTEKGDQFHQPGPTGEDSGSSPHRANPALALANLLSREEAETTRQTTLTLCDEPLKLEVKGEEVLVDTQIQLYATNAQLCHPWVSPVLGYLGGLPPLFIMAGDKEVLRDEILYVAHKAAHPDENPIRDDVRAMLPSLNGIEERFGPTNVHLQVYDGACHDLPLFSMTKVSRGLFRAIASFARYVTPTAPGSLSIHKSRTTTPSGSGSRTPLKSEIPVLSQTDETAVVTEEPASLETPPFVTPMSSLTDLTSPPPLDMSHLSVTSSNEDRTRIVDSPAPMSSSSSKKEKGSLKFARFTSMHASTEGDAGRLPDKATLGPELSGDDAGPRFGEDPADADSRAKPGEAGHTAIYKGDNPFTDHMIRERVATDGTCRPLEPQSELQGLNMPRDEIGMIKEGPAIRYLNGQSLWDKKFKHAIKTVARHRKKNLRNAHERDTGKISRMWDEKLRHRKAEREKLSAEGSSTPAKVARDVRTVGDARDEDSDAPGLETGPGTPDTDSDSASEYDFEEAVGVEQTPETKERQDTVEETMVNESWSWSWALDGEAPPPSAIVSRRDFSEARQMALMADRMDTAHDSSFNGLSIWVGLAAFFSNSSERSQAHDALQRVHEVQQAQEAERGTLPGESAVGRGTVETVEKGLGRMGRMFGIGKK